MSSLTKILVFDDEEDTEDLFLQAFRHQVEDGIYEFFFATSVEKPMSCWKAVSQTYS